MVNGSHYIALCSILHARALRYHCNFNICLNDLTSCILIIAFFLHCSRQRTGLRNLGKILGLRIPADQKEPLFQKAQGRTHNLPNPTQLLALREPRPSYPPIPDTPIVQCFPMALDLDLPCDPRFSSLVPDAPPTDERSLHCLHLL